jgi:SAM-dependent methyltransferase
MFARFLRPEDAVIDFGCGGGWLLKELNTKFKLGVEPNPAARAQCEANGVRAVADIKLVTEKADVVVSNHCLEHVPYPIEALRQIKDVLKPGGKLILVVPIDDWRAQKTFNPDNIDHHLHTWTPRLLGNTLTEGGFKVESIAILTSAWPPKYMALRRILPRPLFDFCCWLTAILRHRRQLLAIAR